MLHLLRVRDHWGATDDLWMHGDEVVTWHFTFENHPEVQAFARQVAPVLDRAYLDVVPPQWLHLTTQGVGLRRAVTSAMQDQIVSRAATRLFHRAPLPMTLGPPQQDDEGVVMAVEDDGRLQQLRFDLQDADAEVRGMDHVPDWRTDFAPHVSLAYANTAADASNLILPDTAMSVTLRTVSLLGLQRTRGLYSWELLARVPLGGA